MGFLLSKKQNPIKAGAQPSDISIPTPPLHTHEKSTTDVRPTTPQVTPSAVPPPPPHDEVPGITLEPLSTDLAASTGTQSRLPSEVSETYFKDSILDVDSATDTVVTLTTSSLASPSIKSLSNENAIPTPPQHDNQLGFVKQNPAVQTVQTMAGSLNQDMKSKITAAAGTQTPASISPVRGPNLQKRDPNQIQLVNLRTYEDDIKYAVRNQNMNKARMLMAEQNQKQSIEKARTNQTLTNAKNRVFLTLAIVLLFVGLGVLGYFFFISKQNPLTLLQPKLEITKPTFLDVDLSREIIYENRFRQTIEDELKNVIRTPFEQKKVREILFTKTITVQENQTQKVTISTKDFINFLETRAPDQLIRALHKDYLLGIYSETPDSLQPFIIYKVTDRENAFRGMLDWEPVLARDMQMIFTQFDESIIHASDFNNDPAEVQTETSTSTSAAPVESGPRYDQRSFVDKIILNRDTRAIVDTDGTTIFFYSFIDDDHLLMANNKETLREILVRMRSAQLIR